MDETTYTHKDLARMLGVSETTIKSYRRKFPDCIPVASNGKPIRFTDQAGEICLYIRDLFSRGMSVAEVSTRLTERFAWTPPQDSSATTEEDTANTYAESSAPEHAPPRTASSEETAAAISNLAKSMVELSMQQKIILKKIQTIDARLEQLDASPSRASSSASSGAELPDSLVAWLNHAEAVLTRIESQAGGERPAEGASKKVVRVRSASGEETEYRMETQGSSEADWQTDTSAPHEDTGDAADMPPAHEASAESPAAPSAEQSAGETAQDVEPSQPQQESQHKEAAPRIVPFPAQGRPQPVLQDPPKQFQTLPLVIKNDDDEFLGVAGRSRGRFNIGDLKAVLMDNFFGVQRYHSHWEKTPNGWLLVLNQKDAPKEEQKNLALLVNQTTTPRGNDVILIQHLTINGTDENTLEVPQFIKAIFDR